MQEWHSGAGGGLGHLLGSGPDYYGKYPLPTYEDVTWDPNKQEYVDNYGNVVSYRDLYENYIQYNLASKLPNVSYEMTFAAGNDNLGGFVEYGIGSGMYIRVNELGVVLFVNSNSGGVSAELLANLANSGKGAQELIANSVGYWGITGSSWLWGGTAALNAHHFRADAASRAAGKLVGKITVGLNVAATAAEGYDLVTNWEQAGRGDVTKFGVDATLTTVTTILYFTGVGTPVAIILTGVQVANTLGAFDSIYESFNEPLNNGIHGGGGSW